jgi:hypothetical protein
MTDTLEISHDDLANSEEELHPELAEYLFESDISGLPQGMLALKHPLMYQIPYFPKANGYYNKAYAYKKEKVEEALFHGRWAEYIVLHERAWRHDALLTCLQEGLGDDEDGDAIWQRIASVWMDSENIHQNLESWMKLWTSNYPNRRAAMDPKEQKAFDKLPDMVDVYRGVRHDVAAKGLSWTLDRSRAIWFAHRFIHGDCTPHLVTAMVPKKCVLAHFLRKNEDEIVAHPKHVIITDIKVLEKRVRR